MKLTILAFYITLCGTAFSAEVTDSDVTIVGLDKLDGPGKACYEKIGGLGVSTIQQSRLAVVPERSGLVTISVVGDSSNAVVQSLQKTSLVFDTNAREIFVTRENEIYGP